MADIYTPPPEFSYLLATPFHMPDTSGDRWAVAFTNNDATIMTAALSVMVTLSFLCLWNLICFTGMLFTGGKRPLRYAALVTLWNSNDSWFAFKELLYYSSLCLCKLWALTRSPSGPPSAPAPSETSSNPSKPWEDFWYGFVFCLLALAVFVGGLVMGIIAPSLVEIGNVAPVRANAVFYPQTPPADPVKQLQDFGLRAPAVLRALGSVEAAKVTLRNRVMAKADDSYPSTDDGRVVGLDYSYHLSGVDMGLRGGSDLALDLVGSCITEYSWKAEPEGEDLEEVDWYYLWNDPDNLEWVLINENDIMHAPSASFFTPRPSEGEDQLIRDSNVSYAVLIHSAHRSSIKAGGDPWYETESRGDSETAPSFDAQFWVKRHRPVLSCWEQSRWSYGTHEVDSVFDLKAIPGIKIAQVLLEVLETTLGAGPMIVRLGNASGDSALRSRTTSPNGVINAEDSSMFDDMERLILASFVATRSIFTDATMFGLPDNYENVMTGADGQPRDGAGNFVVSSPDIQTFSLTGIVTLATILAALILANSVAWLIVKFNPDSSEGMRVRCRALAAAQLFRSVRRDGDIEWKCGDLEPKKRNNPQGIITTLVETTECKAKCKGHTELKLK